MIPVQVDQIFLYGGIVPLSLDELREKVETEGGDLNSPMIPTIALKLWKTKDKIVNSFPLELRPTEKESDKAGLGHLPLLEAVGVVEPNLPGHEEVEEQLCLFLISLGLTNNLNQARLSTVLNSGILPTSVTGLLGFIWPEFRGPLGDQARQSATGMLLIHSSVFVHKTLIRVFTLIDAHPDNTSGLSYPLPNFSVLCVNITEELV